MTFPFPNKFIFMLPAPSITSLPPLRLIGMRDRHSLSAPTTVALWRQFMPRLHELTGKKGTDLYAVQRYGDMNPSQFDPQAEFEHWAAALVHEEAPVPAGMEELRIAGGRYAVFLHRGPVHTFPRTAGYIYGQWLAQSSEQLADRCHFQVMDHRYKGGTEPDSEEDVWVPLV